MEKVNLSVSFLLLSFAEIHFQGGLELLREQQDELGDLFVQDSDLPESHLLVLLARSCFHYFLKVTFVHFSLYQ